VNEKYPHKFSYKNSVVEILTKHSRGLLFCAAPCMTEIVCHNGDVVDESSDDEEDESVSVTNSKNGTMS